ncbi:alpha/beta fold hydrolase [Novosphingobium pentaromativorans]|nr:alpha/beta hydrolase [Novosphingobium pentaromativorans]AIT80471.1 beta-ketoadipate enol-lactone hydrolase [Novosphingobium pentaromativorans US6-1]
MPIIASGDCRLNVLVEGPADGPPILLAHYLGGRLETFEGQMPALAGRRVIRFDMRGHGASDAPEGDYSVEMLGRDVLAILDALNVERVDFLGVSLGGIVGIWFAAEHPERIGRLILANTSAYLPNKDMWRALADQARDEGLDQIARSMLAGWLSAGFRESEAAEVDTLVRHMAMMPVRGYRGNVAVLRDVDLRGSLARIAAPTLVIGGEEDGPRSASVPILTQGVQHGRSAMMPGAAHLSHIEAPGAFNAAMVAHLERHPGDDRT